MKKNKAQPLEQEWSHFFSVEDLDDVAEAVTIEADDASRDRLCQRLNDVEEIKALTAGLNLIREQGGRVVYVYGSLTADIVQNCVVTLEPLDIRIEEEVQGWFADKDSAVSFAAAKRERDYERSTEKSTHGEIEMMPEQEDPEPIIGGMVDLGELVTQHLSLAIPPYPHKEGVKYEFGDDDIQIEEDSPLKKNPFEALKDWKEGR